jgi:acyl carrier protein
MKTTYERLKEIIVVRLGAHPDQITPDTRLVEDLGMDSLDIVQLIMAVEEDMADMMPDGIADEAIEHVKTIQEAVDAIDTFYSENVSRG